MPTVIIQRLIIATAFAATVPLTASCSSHGTTRAPADGLAKSGSQPALAVARDAIKSTSCDEYMTFVEKNLRPGDVSCEFGIEEGNLDCARTEAKWVPESKLGGADSRAHERVVYYCAPPTPTSVTEGYKPYYLEVDVRQKSGEWKIYSTFAYASQPNLSSDTY